MSVKKRETKTSRIDHNGLLALGQVVTLVIGYPDGGSETIHRGAVVGADGPLVKIRKDERETVINTASIYFIKAEIEERVVAEGSAESMS